MLKIKNITHKFSGKDSKYASVSLMPDVDYEIYIYRPEGWLSKLQQFAKLEEGQDYELALELIGQVLIAVYQDDERYTIGTTEKAKALVESVESQAPGLGKPYARWLVYAINSQISDLQDERLGNSGELPMVSSNGSNQESLVSTMET